MSDTNNRNSCPQKPCQSTTSRQFDNTQIGPGDSDLSGRPVLYTGVLWIGILRRFLIPQPVRDSRPCCHRNSRDKPEARNVALITTPTNTSSGSYIQSSALGHHKPQELRDQDQLSTREKQENKLSPSATLVYQIQEVSAVLKDEVLQFSNNLSELIQDGKANATETLYTLREDEGEAGRYSAVTITSLLGYMAGMRRSVAVRLVYAATGAVATATLCYPEEARYCNNVALAIIREGVRLSVQLCRFGLQETLVKKDSVKQEKLSSIKKEQPNPKSYFKPSQEPESTSKGDNKAASQERNIGEFEHRIKQSHLSLTSEHDNVQQNRLFSEHQEKPLRDSHSQFVPHRGGKLSRECQQDKMTRVVPYSQALPLLPDIEQEPDDSFQNSDTFKYDQNEPNTTPDKSFKANLKEKDDLQLNSLHDDSRSSLKSNTSSLTEQNIIHPKNNSETNDVTSTTIEPVEEVVKGSSINENQQYCPLNKKLHRYYVENENETLKSPEVEYDDLYSKK